MFVIISRQHCKWCF